MGEMADDFLNDVLDEEDRRLAYRYGDISADEAYDMGIIDELGYMPSAYTGSSTLKICKCCGETGLNWDQHQGKWRLFKGGKLHICKVNPLK